MCPPRKTVLSMLPITWAVLLVPLVANSAATDAVFPLHTKSILGENGQISADTTVYGATQLFVGPCSTTAAPGIKYPQLKSAVPLYGYVTFGKSADATQSGCYFVLDESSPADVEKEQPPKNVKRNYDVLFFDANRDKDLTNDPKTVTAKSPLERLPFYSGPGGVTQSFQTVTTKQTGPLIPWLNLRNPQQAYMILMSTTVRAGTIKIGEQSYEVLLGNQYRGQTGRVMAKPEGGTRWQAMSLNRLQKLHDDFYTISVNNTGDQLTVSPYQGKYGFLKVAANAPDIEKMGVSGTVYAQDQTNLTLGDAYVKELPRQHQLPENEYRASLVLDYGSVRAYLSTTGYNMSIRDQHPVVLDFSEKPTVRFTSPSAKRVYRPGAGVQFKAMLHDSVTGMMIRGLYDTNNPIRTRTITVPDGTKVEMPTYATLVPEVTITNSKGKQIATGKMPFG